MLYFNTKDLKHTHTHTHTHPGTKAHGTAIEKVSNQDSKLSFETFTPTPSIRRNDCEIDKHPVTHIVIAEGQSRTFCKVTCDCANYADVCVKPELLAAFRLVPERDV